MQEFSRVIAGQEYHVQVGLLAQQCNGSVLVTVGGTSVLATATMSRKPREGIDFVPLMVNYQEKFYAVGKILGSRFMRREARPPDEMVLAGRLVDRQIRPLFPKHLRNEVQVMLNVLQYDGEHDHTVVSALAGSMALAISDIPWNGPTACVRVGLLRDDFLCNVPNTLHNEGTLDLMVASTSTDVIMIEAAAQEVSEDVMLKALDAGQAVGNELCDFVNEVQKAVGKTKVELPTPEVDIEIKQWIADTYTAEMEKCIYECEGKLDRFAQKDNIREAAHTAAVEQFGEERVETAGFGELFEKVFAGIIRHNILTQGRRIKGRKLDEIRELSVHVGILPRAHGSGLFQRGETQGMSVLTLGAPGDEQIVETINGESKRRYMHHYNFPPFSVGEVSPRLSTGNREIGHGALAQRALEPVLPDSESFPYVIRVVSEILQSNGSSSMAATCGSTLALMDGGVPIKAPVAGIAMGLMTDSESDTFAVLTDLQDEEDFGGDMDFKVAGTKDGITAIQMDVKIPGIAREIFVEAFQRAYEGRMRILEAMLAVLPQTRPQLAENAPRIQAIMINPEKIGMVIGKGGETINGIVDRTGAQINIEDSGRIAVSGPNQESVEQAVEIIQGIVADPEVGKIYTARVVRVEDYGAFAEFMPGKQGLIHVSTMADKRIDDPRAIVAVGDEVPVKLVEIDNQGRVRLSMKDAQSA